MEYFEVSSALHSSEVHLGKINTEREHLLSLLHNLQSKSLATESEKGHVNAIQLKLNELNTMKILQTRIQNSLQRQEAFLANRFTNSG